MLSKKKIDEYNQSHKNINLKTIAVADYYYYPMAAISKSMKKLTESSLSPPPKCSHSTTSRTPPSTIYSTLLILSALSTITLLISSSSLFRQSTLGKTRLLAHGSVSITTSRHIHCKLSYCVMKTISCLASLIFHSQNLIR